jgi:RNA polymerase sigma-70 factor, ECF subfamily
MKQRRLRVASVRGEKTAEGPDDVSSFEQFFETYAPVLYRRLCIVTGDRYEAEELMQDAFLKILERWDRVRGLDDPEGYLYRTALNLFRKRLRRAAVAVRRRVHADPDPDEFARSDDRLTVGQALRQLTPRQRAVLVLTELVGYSTVEAAGILRVRPGTVRALAFQGRAALRRAMEASRD